LPDFSVQKYQNGETITTDQKYTKVPLNLAIDHKYIQMVTKETNIFFSKVSKSITQWGFGYENKPLLQP
jgi:hypothetical protein